MSIRDKDTRRLPNLMLQEERLRRGWTQQEVANRVGTTVVNVSRWERGVTFPNPYFRQKLGLLFEKGAEELGLLPIKQFPQRETTLAAEEVAPDLPEKVSVTTANELVATPNEIAPLPLRKRLFGERRAVVVTFISLALVIFVGGSGFLTHSFFFSQHKSIPQASSYQETSFTPTGLGKVIAQDTFHRPNQRFWGTASDGLKWEGDANTWKNFSLANNKGRIETIKGGVTFNAVLDVSTNNVDVLFSGSMSTFADSNMGAVLRWNGDNNWYKAYINGTELIIQKMINGNKFTINHALFTADGETSYTIRFHAVGTSLFAKAWPTVSREPSKWTVTASDSSLSSGYCGLRVEVLHDAIATITSFVARRVS